MGFPDFSHHSELGEKEETKEKTIPLLKGHSDDKDCMGLSAFLNLEALSKKAPESVMGVL